MLRPLEVSIDELLRECELSPAVVITVLLKLELVERLERTLKIPISLIWLRAGNLVGDGILSLTEDVKGFLREIETPWMLS